MHDISNHFTITIQPNGVIMLPPEALAVLNVAPGDILVAAPQSGGLSIHSARLMQERKAALDNIRTQLKSSFPANLSLMDELIAGRRLEVSNEGDLLTVNRLTDS